MLVLLFLSLREYMVYSHPSHLGVLVEAGEVKSNGQVWKLLKRATGLLEWSPPKIGRLHCPTSERLMELLVPHQSDQGCFLSQLPQLIQWEGLRM